ncbi:hypothetical protein Syun_012726 [Stephania yunnanensis]|uniref:Uncharacterized protein n=1 Tax=Stephania yunnanensis TaxID=152371 RepID=A0AAP0K050_9MAGN
MRNSYKYGNEMLSVLVKELISKVDKMSKLRFVELLKLKFGIGEIKFSIELKSQFKIQD